MALPRRTTCSRRRGGDPSDVDVLKRHGINKHKVKNSPLAFLQLLLPICDPKQSGIPDDGRMPFVTDARQYTNTYATTDKGMGGAYNHHFDLVDEIELLRWMAVPIRHGARGGCPGHIHSRWCTSDDDYDKYISESMTFSRWKQIKSIFKMSNNAFTPKRGAEGYDPGSKYDLLYRVMVHNMNYVTKKAELDCGVDESTWGFQGYMGDAGGRLKNKPYNKGTFVWATQCIIYYGHPNHTARPSGGQTVMIFDCHRRYPRAYVHRHKCHTRPEGFGQEGPSELYMLLEEVNHLVKGVKSTRSRRSS